MQQTSILAYASIKDKLGQNQYKVLQALEEIAPACNRQIAEHLGWPINSVTPRTLELRLKRKVVKAYQAPDITGRAAIHWKPAKSKDEYGDSE